MHGALVTAVTTTRARARAAKKVASTEPPSRVPTAVTATQLVVLVGLHRLTKKFGRPPTTPELAEGLGYADHTGVLKPLRALVRLRLIRPVEQVVVRGHALTPAGRRKLP